MPKSKSTKSRSVLKGRKIKPPKKGKAPVLTYPGKTTLVQKGKATKSEHMTKRALHGMYKRLKSGERTTSILTPGQVCPRNKRRWDRKKPKSGWPLVSCKKKKIGERVYRKNKPIFDNWVRSLREARRWLRTDAKMQKKYGFPQKSSKAKRSMLVYPSKGSPDAKSLTRHQRHQRILYKTALEMHELNTPGKRKVYALSQEHKLKGKRGVRDS